MRRYLESDFDMICSWYKDHGLMAPKFRDLPKIGFIEPGVAAGFLVQTDSSVAIIDFFITNPAAGRRKRSATLDEIASAVIGHARSLKFRMVYAAAQIPAIQERARGCGLKFGGDFAMWTKEL